MPNIIIDEDRCKGCGLCISVCPRQLITMSKSKINQNGYFVAQVEDISGCTGCTSCAMMCPDVAITVER